MIAKDAAKAHIEPDSVKIPAVAESAPLGVVLEKIQSAPDGVLRVVCDGDDDNACGGIITKDTIISTCAGLFPQLQESTELTIVCPAGHYSASSIAHAVEDADAHLLNLNVTQGTLPNSATTVEIRVNHSRGSMVARSLMRYGYETIAMRSSSADPFDETTVQRANALLHLLDV